MPIGKDNYDPHYSAGVKADASKRPDAVQTKHTPGQPFTIVKRGHDAWAVRRGDGAYIAVNLTEAEARILGAAHEMREVLTLISNTCEHPAPGQQRPRLSMTTVDNIRALLARIDGTEGGGR